MGLRLFLKSSLLASRAWQGTYRGIHFLNMNTMTTTRACEACAYWNKVEHDHGECRRHAPQTVAFEVDEEVKFESMFPVTAGDDWCGDFCRAD